VALDTKGYAAFRLMSKLVFGTSPNTGVVSPRKNVEITKIQLPSLVLEKNKNESSGHAPIQDQASKILIFDKALVFLGFFASFTNPLMLAT